MRVILGGSPKIFYDFPAHQHGCWEILLCLTGAGTAVIDGRDYPFEEGTVFCIPPGVVHSKHAPEGYSDFSLFTTDFVPPDAARVLVYQDDADRTFTRLCRIAMRLRLREGDEAEPLIDSIADTLYQLLLRWNGTRRHPRAVDDFLRLLMDNLSDSGFDLGRAIAGTGYSPGYFRKLFRSATGMSPGVCFTRMRMEYAKTLLRQSEGRQPVRVIAEAVGFSDPYYFSRTFKEYTGVSPRAYLTQSGDRSLVSSGDDAVYRSTVGIDPEPGDLL